MPGNLEDRKIGQGNTAVTLLTRSSKRTVSLLRFLSVSQSWLFLRLPSRACDVM